MTRQLSGTIMYLEYKHLYRKLTEVFRAVYSISPIFVASKTYIQWHQSLYGYSPPPTFWQSGDLVTKYVYVHRFDLLNLISFQET